MKKVFKSEKKDWWDELSDEQKTAIDEGLEDFKNGNVVSWDEFIKPHL